METKMHEQVSIQIDHAGFLSAQIIMINIIGYQ